MALCVAIAGCTTVSEDDLAALKSHNPVLKQKTLRSISEAGGFPVDWVDTFVNRKNEEKAIAIMVKLLRSGKESKDIEISILKALENLSKKRVVPTSPLIEKLTDEDSRVRAKAIEAVAKAKAKEASPLLVKQLEGDQNKYVLIWALGEIGDKSAVPALNGLLRNQDENVQYIARKALEKIDMSVEGEEEAAPRKTSDIFGRFAAFNKEYQKVMISVFRRIQAIRNGD
jgi:HEAT repeat protein